MIYKNEVLVIKDKAGIEKEYAILVTFDMKYNGKSYVLYTDYSTDENGSVKILASCYDENWKLSPLTENEEIEIVKEYIGCLETDIKQGMKFI